MTRWDVETREFPEAHGPVNLVYTAGDSRGLCQSKVNSECQQSRESSDLHMGNLAHITHVPTGTHTHMHMPLTHVHMHTFLGFLI